MKTTNATLYTFNLDEAMVQDVCLMLENRPIEFIKWTDTQLIICVQ